MATFEIKHVEGEIPSVSRRSKYPFSQMKVRDYIEVPATEKAISSICYSYGKKHGMKFITRRCEDVIQVIRVE